MAPPTFTSVEDERAHRKGRLAVAYRLFAQLGYDHWVAGHITVRDPEFPHQFWLNPFGRSWRHLRASDLLLVDLEGRLLAGEGAVNAAAFAIHSEIHRARPDVTAIAHAHTRSGRAWSATGRLLEPLSQDACAFYDDHAIFDDFSGVVYGSEEGGALGRRAGRQQGAAPPAPRAPDRRRDGRRGRVLAPPARAVLRGAAAPRVAPAARRRIRGRTARSARPSPPTPARQVGEHVHGWMGFQPLYEEIVRADPDVLR